MVTTQQSHIALGWLVNAGVSQSDVRVQEQSGNAPGWLRAVGVSEHEIAWFESIKDRTKDLMQQAPFRRRLNEIYEIASRGLEEVEEIVVTPVAELQ